MAAHKSTAGYFADVGNDFDNAVYQRQLATGERQKLSDVDYLNAVDTTLGRWQYNQMKAKIGDKPSAAQSAWLAGYKQALQKQYPGWVDTPPTDNVTTKIQQLAQAAKDPRMSDNRIAMAVRDYMTLRDQALAAAKSSKTSLTGVNGGPLRQWLDEGAMRIEQDIPEFSRVYDDLLSAETQP
jgi:hypothetical protein